MKRGAKVKPTEKELEILQVLWNRGPSTVREVHTELSARGGTGYTTALKLMQIMHEKGLLARDESERTHVYRTTKTKEQVETALVGGLVDRLFAGSAERLALRAFASRRLSTEELRRIRTFLDDYEEGRSRRRGGS